MSPNVVGLLQEVPASVEIAEAADLEKQEYDGCCLLGPRYIDLTAEDRQLHIEYQGEAKSSSGPCTRQQASIYLEQLWIGKKYGREDLIGHLSNSIWARPDSDLSCLRHNTEWLSDEVINGFLGIICEKKPDIGCMSTFFYNRLRSCLQLSSEDARDSEMTNLCRWFLPKEGTRNLKREYFVPININRIHYVFVHANLNLDTSISQIEKPSKRRKKAAVPTLTLYDSYHVKLQSCLDDLELFFQHLACQRDYPELQCGWGKKYGRGPTQYDGYNCGLFVCAGIDCLSNGMIPTGYTSSTMPAFRGELQKLFTDAGLGLQS